MADQMLECFLAGEASVPAVRFACPWALAEGQQLWQGDWEAVPMAALGWAVILWMVQERPGLRKSGSSGGRVGVVGPLGGG